MATVPIERGAAVAGVIADNVGTSAAAGAAERIDHWALTRVQRRLAKTGGRLVKHARDDGLLRADSHLTRRLLGAMVRRITALPVPAG